MKPQNVPLDCEFKPKISNFGLGKILLATRGESSVGARELKHPYPKNYMEIRGRNGETRREKREIKRKRSGWRMEEGEGDEPLPPVPCHVWFLT